MAEISDIFAQRETYSRVRLSELGTRLASSPDVQGLDHLAIFCGGSYARHEASEHSDIDLFFLYETEPSPEDGPRLKELRLFAGLIGIAESMQFPEFSNDGEYLKTLSWPEMERHLGSREDDYMNSFTVRMLMLLESKVLFGHEPYDKILRSIISSYYRDYPNHQATFEPWFLLNDIGRFWKTLLLNYENKRHQAAGSNPTKQKVRNFKLKYSRMTTCFATVAAIGSESTPVTGDQVYELVQMTPRERLQKVAENRPPANSEVDAVLNEYAWFLEQTALTEEDLHRKFEDKNLRRQLFDRANRYGDLMFELLAALDHDPTGPSRKFLRYLVI